MSFSEAVKKVFSNYANFNGRARRSEYWYWQLFTFVVSMALSVVNGAFQAIFDSVTPVSILLPLWSVAIIIPNLAVGVRRLHDIGKSGASILIALIPIVGSIILMFVWFVEDSQPGANQYGENPKGVGNQPFNPNDAQPQYNNDPNGYYAPQQPAAPTGGQYYAPQQPVAPEYYAPQQPAAPAGDQYYAPQPTPVPVQSEDANQPAQDQPFNPYQPQ